MDISKALDWIKLSPRPLTGIALATGAYLLLGPKKLDYLGLTSLDAQGRPWVAVAFIMSTALLVAHVIFEVTAIAHTRWQHYVVRKYRQAVLRDLSPEERVLLAAYIHGDTKTLRLSLESGIAAGLEADKIISLASGFGSSSGFEYNIQPWARDYLRQHPDLLYIPEVEESS